MLNEDLRLLDGIDLADEKLYAEGDPLSVWAALRRAHPVYFNVRPDEKSFWALTRYADCARVLKDTKTFVSSLGMRLDHNPSATASAAAKLLIVTDAPRHAKIRRLMASVFTPRMVSRLEENMRMVIREEIESIANGTPFEFADFASILPLSVICDLLGVPEEDWPFMLECTKIAFGESGADSLDKMEAHASILDYYQELIGDRRQSPREDLVSTLVHGRIDGMPLTEEEIFLNCDGLISGGNETTRHATIGGLLALIRNPEQWRNIANNPEETKNFTDEILRYTSPAAHVLRTPREDVEVGGQLIQAGEPVTVWIPSANRDESVFSDADRFDVSRSASNHLTFGAGSHYCLGSALARTELRVFFSELLGRISAAEIAGPVRRLRSNLIWGYESVPISLRCN